VAAEKDAVIKRQADAMSRAETVKDALKAQFAETIADLEAKVAQAAPLVRADSFSRDPFPATVCLLGNLVSSRACWIVDPGAAGFARLPTLRETATGSGCAVQLRHFVLHVRLRTAAVRTCGRLSFGANFFRRHAGHGALLCFLGAKAPWQRYGILTARWMRHGSQTPGRARPRTGSTPSCGLCSRRCPENEASSRA
jgi:hypothetical protein